MPSAPPSLTLQLPPLFPRRHPLEHLLLYRRDALGLFERARELADVVRLRLSPKHVLTLAFAPADVERVLVGNAANYDKRTPGYDRLRDLLGDGLLTSDGDLWRGQRRAVQPLFKRRHLASFGPVMTEVAASMADSWESAADSGQPLDVAQAMNSLALDVAGRTLFSADLRGTSDALGRAMEAALRRFMSLLSTPIPGFAYWPTPVNLRGRRASAWLNRTVRDLIAERRRSGVQPDPPDLLALLMQATDDAGQPMPDRLLRDEALTMLLAGHETTANALAWTFFLLGLNPEARAPLEAEVDAVLGGRAATVDDVEELPYTWQVLQESMRLYPPAWVIARHALGDDVLSGYRIPAGSFVLMPQIAIHRHPALWDDPLRFDPTRFRPGWEHDKPRYAYFPFGGGQRLCLGEGFARQEAVIALATLSQRFRLELVPEHRVVPEPSVTLRPRDGIMARVRRR
jgi:cytochrome P450